MNRSWPVPLTLALLLVLLFVGCQGATETANDAATTGDTSGAADADYETLTPAVVAGATAVREAALQDEQAYDFLESLTVEVGPRLAGSAGDERAVEWAQAQLNAWGFDNVRAEPVQVPHWQRGHAIGTIVTPYRQDVVVVALGGSIGTPAGGIEAEVVQVADLDELGGLDRTSIEGKIVFVEQRMERTRDGSGYGAAVGKRVAGASLAGAKGAVAVLIRSAGTSNSRVAHTGTMRYSEDAPQIPAAALSNPDADMLAAQVARGGAVRFHLDLGSRFLPDEMSANVIGEIIGSEKPEEIVLLVGHLDSWDLGTGALDDGVGCAIAAAAARLIGNLPERPKRTIRVWFAANEEFGLDGARAYAEQYALDVDLHVAATEADFGVGSVWRFRSRIDEAHLGVARDLERLLAPLGIEYVGNDARGGADLSPLRSARVPMFDLSQDGTAYFDYHHTINDTLDKVDRESLRQNVAAYATWAYVMANLDGDVGRAPVPEESR